MLGAGRGKLNPSKISEADDEDEDPRISFTKKNPKHQSNQEDPEQEAYTDREEDSDSCKSESSRDSSPTKTQQEQVTLFTSCHSHLT